MTINIEKKDAVTTIILNRAEARNAVNRPMAEALANAFREFDQDDSARVAVLYGEDTFCAGADLKAVARPIAWQPKATAPWDQAVCCCPNP